MTAATLLDPEETTVPLELMRWTREQFEAAEAAGMFVDDSRIELLDGYILAMPVQHPPHATGVEATRQCLAAAFGRGYCVRAQMPFSLDDLSAPEPDVAVVPGSFRDYATAHPTRALLLAEVSDSTLAKDRGRKLRAYARNGVPEYWIVNLPDHQLEVHRQPQGNAYAERLILHPGQTVSPLARPEASVAVGELLP